MLSKMGNSGWAGKYRDGLQWIMLLVCLPLYPLVSIFGPPPMYIRIANIINIF